MFKQFSNNCLLFYFKAKDWKEVKRLVIGHGLGWKPVQTLKLAAACIESKWKPCLGPLWLRALRCFPRARQQNKAQFARLLALCSELSVLPKQRGSSRPLLWSAEIGASDSNMFYRPNNSPRRRKKLGDKRTPLFTVFWICCLTHLPQDAQRRGRALRLLCLRRLATWERLQSNRRL